MRKRYQYFSKNGIEWTDWFTPFNDLEQQEWQLKNKLKNEWKQFTP